MLLRYITVFRFLHFTFFFPGDGGGVKKTCTLTASITYFKGFSLPSYPPPPHTHTHTHLPPPLAFNPICTPCPVNVNTGPKGCDKKYSWIHALSHNVGRARSLMSTSWTRSKRWWRIFLLACQKLERIGVIYHGQAATVSPCKHRSVWKHDATLWMLNTFKSKLTREVPQQTQ